MVSPKKPLLMACVFVLGAMLFFSAAFHCYRKRETKDILYVYDLSWFGGRIIPSFKNQGAEYSVPFEEAKKWGKEEKAILTYKNWDNKLIIDIYCRDVDSGVFRKASESICLSSEVRGGVCEACDVKEVRYEEDSHSIIVKMGNIDYIITSIKAFLGFAATIFLVELLIIFW